MHYDLYLTLDATFTSFYYYDNNRTKNAVHMRVPLVRKHHRTRLRYCEREEEDSSTSHRSRKSVCIPKLLLISVYLLL